MKGLMYRCGQARGTARKGVEWAGSCGELMFVKMGCTERPLAGTEACEKAEKAETAPAWGTQQGRHCPILLLPSHLWLHSILGASRR